MDVTDPIVKLLQTTGLSCDDLLARLQQYKSQTQTNGPDQQEEPTTDNENCEEEKNESSLDSETASQKPFHTSATDSDPKTVITDLKNSPTIVSNLITTSDLELNDSRNKSIELKNDTCSNGAQPSSRPLEEKKLDDGISEIINKEFDETPSKDIATTENNNLRETAISEQSDYSSSLSPFVSSGSTYPRAAGTVKDRIDGKSDTTVISDDKSDDCESSERRCERFHRKINQSIYDDKSSDVSDNLLPSEVTCEKLSLSKPRRSLNKISAILSKRLSKDHQDPEDIQNTPEASTSGDKSRDDSRDSSCMEQDSSNTTTVNNDLGEDYLNHEHEDTSEVSNSEEKLRDILKMQLSSLRNKKKTDGLLTGTLHKASLSAYNVKRKYRKLSLSNDLPCSSRQISEMNCSQKDVERPQNIELNSVSEARPENSQNSTDTFRPRIKIISVHSRGEHDSVWESTKVSECSKVRTEFAQNTSKEKNIISDSSNTSTNDETANENKLMPSSDTDDPKSAEIHKDGIAPSTENPTADPKGAEMDKASIVSLTEDTQFLILEVTGGVDRVGSLKSPDKSDGLVNAPQEKIEFTHDTSHKFVTEESSNSKDLMCHNQPSPAEVTTVQQGSDLKGRKVDNSPFVSNQLEDFLSENARLNISYSIPKLGAEDTLNESTKESPYDNDNQVPPRAPTMHHVKPSGTSENAKPVKAKTLAEMRRQIESNLKKENPSTDDKKGVPTKRKKYKGIERAPRTSTDSQAETSSSETFTKSVKGLKSSMIKNKSYVLFNNRRIWIPCNISDKCLGTIQEKPKTIAKVAESKPEITKVPKRKRSLLSTLVMSERVKYKPGPLCKKIKLQNEESTKDWCTEIKRLPQIYLEVLPLIGKPVRPKIRHILTASLFSDPIITEQRTNFALSVLKTKESYQGSTTVFKFPVSYRNDQKQIAVRRRVEAPTSTNIPHSESFSSPETDVKNVINDLITYVEIKEISESLIQDDDFAPNQENAPEIQKEDCGKTGRTVQKSRKRRLMMELQRLNCKFIDVQGDTDGDGECSKPFCNMGCVCKSLQCGGNYSDHCQLVDCMFGCKCPPAAKKLVSPNNSLSEDAVNHLDDKAKRNLAKVEKEFTQTIIQTGDDMILVRSGGRDKNKRASRFPKKYSDYVESSILDKPTDNKSSQKHSCSVHLEKMDLSDAIPFCMEHDQYKCHCMNIRGLNSDVDRKIPPLKINIKKLLSDKKKHKEEKRMKRENTIIDSEEHIPRGETCARMRPIFQNYLERNKDAYYNSRLRKKFREPGDKSDPMLLFDTSDTWQRVHIIETSSKKHNRRKQSFGFKSVVPEEVIIVDDLSKSETIGDHDYDSVPTSHSSAVDDPAHRALLRQYLECNRNVSNQDAYIGGTVSDDTPQFVYNMSPHFAIQRRKKYKPSAKAGTSRHDDCSVKAGDASNCASNSIDAGCEPQTAAEPTESADIYVKIFEGEIKVSLEENQAMLEVIGKNHSNLKYLRILPWKNLIKSFRNGTISVWCMYDKPQVLLCNKSNKCPPKNFIDINLVEEGTHIINWIKSGQLPPGKDPELLHIVLTPTKNHFLLSGFCLKNAQSSSQTTLTDNSESDDAINPNLNPLSVSVTCPDNATSLDHDPLSMSATEHAEPPYGSINSINNRLSVTATAQSTKALEEDTSKPERQLPANIKHYAGNLIEKAKKILTCTHKDMNNVTRTLRITTKMFPSFVFEEDVRMKTALIQASLPNTTNGCRWRMIFLNSNFSFLCFASAEYSIKYKDLMDVVNMANSLNKTVILRSNDISVKYQHPKFGIYCVPSYRDRLFVGPYFRSEDHQLETLRYMHGALVDTGVFNQMYNKSNTTNPKWMRPALRKKILDVPENTICIDITEEEGETTDTNQKNSIVVPVESDPIKDNEIASDSSIHSEESLLCHPFAKKLSSCEIDSANVNRYVVTNIPHLGYLTAFQHDASSIDVFWPECKEGFRFRNVAIARESLKQYFSRIFYTHPQNFRLNVIIMTQLDLELNKPMNSKYLTQKETYVCGDFGIFSLKDLPADIHLTEDDVKKSEGDRAEENSDRMVQLFGSFFQGFGEMKQPYTDPDDILQWAISEIRDQRRTGLQLKEEKNFQSTVMRNHLQRLKVLLKRVPVRAKKDAVLETIRSIMGKAPRTAVAERKPIIDTPVVTETIEIEDSDEEDTNARSEPAKFVEITKSGPIKPLCREEPPRSLPKLKFNGDVKPEIQLAPEANVNATDGVSVLRKDKSEIIPKKQ